MFGTFFYNQGLRKLVIAFGELFNNIVIQSTNVTDGETRRILVPLAYAPKEKFLVRLEQKPDLTDRSFAITLPRMGFEISGISYDASRKLTRVQKYKAASVNSAGVTSTANANYNYTPVPYNISFALHTFTDTAENGLQICEQILPYFQPDYTVTMKSIPSMGINRDIPIILNSVTYEDSYDGTFTTRRAVIYNYTFTAKTYLYGPMSNTGVIKEVDAKIYSDTTATKPDETIKVTPNPTDATLESDFGFTTTILDTTK